MEEKLFTDSEVYQKERPTKITEQQALDFYKEQAQEILDNNWSKSDIDTIVEDLSEINYDDSGYEIAKSLEDWNRKAYYDFPIDFIEFLDNLGHQKGRILANNIKDWVKAHGIKPKLSKGQKLLIEKDLNYKQKKGLVVFVNGFNENEAYYMIDENPDRNGGYCISYEKAESNCSLVND